MKLSRKKAIELCIELWEWLAKTGKFKGEWPEWKKYGEVDGYCWFCEYVEQRGGGCMFCPLMKKLGFGCGQIDCFYSKWEDAETPQTRKKYAKLFLEQIKKCK